MKMRSLILLLAMCSLFSTARADGAAETLASDPAVQAVVNHLKSAGLDALDCLAYLGENQCSSLNRCIAAKSLLQNLRDGKATAQDVSNFTTTSMDCCCVQSLTGGHDFIRKMLDAGGAKPEDERYPSCYGSC